jgi:hypothetical protein
MACLLGLTWPAADGSTEGIKRIRQFVLNHEGDVFMDAKEIENLFTYHAPKADQPQRYEKIRGAAKELAKVIVECCPNCPDTTAAIRKLRESVMTANAAIACNE